MFFAFYPGVFFFLVYLKMESEHEPEPEPESERIKNRSVKNFLSLVIKIHEHAMNNNGDLIQ